MHTDILTPKDLFQKDVRYTDLAPAFGSHSTHSAKINSTIAPYTP